jgi:hypothetical protein
MGSNIKFQEKCNNIMGDGKRHPFWRRNVETRFLPINEKEQIYTQHLHG